VATEPAAAPKAVEGTENASKPLDHEFKIIFRDGGHRLVSVNFVGKSVGDVPLPPNSNFRLIMSEGRYLLSGQGGSELYDAQEHMDALMPPAPPPPQQNYYPFSFVGKLSSVYRLM